jgi:hypothetical protein
LVNGDANPQTIPIMSTTNFQAITTSIRRIALKKLSSALTTQTSTYLTRSSYGSTALLLAVAGGAIWRYRNFGDAKDTRTIQSLLNSGYEGIAVDEIEEGTICPSYACAIAPDATPEVAQMPATFTFGDFGSPTGTIVVEDSAPAPSSAVPAFVEVNNNPAVVLLHRKVKTARSMQYMNACIAECKIKFGVPANTNANRKAVERFASSVMKGHGVRPTHIRQYLPMVTKMVFVPDQWQIEAERLSGTQSAWAALVEFLKYNAASVVPKEEHA